jgi:single-strand DNA-binding protein
MLWREGNDAMRNKLKDHINDVRLRGIVAGAPRKVGLAQGEVVEFRLQVARIEGGSDQLDLVSRLPRLRRSAASLKPGTLVEVVGSVQKRFWSTGTSLASKVEIEVYEITKSP